VDFAKPWTGPWVQFRKIPEPEPEPSWTVLLVWFGFRDALNLNRTERSIRFRFREVRKNLNQTERSIRFRFAEVRESDPKNKGKERKRVRRVRECKCTRNDIHELDLWWMESRRRASKRHGQFRGFHYQSVPVHAFIEYSSLHSI
jgi:hypothetical protein